LNKTKNPETSLFQGFSLAQMERFEVGTISSNTWFHGLFGTVMQTNNDNFDDLMIGASGYGLAT